MADNTKIPDFPNLPDFEHMITQACEVIASVRGIPYDFNGTLSLENKFVVLFKTVNEMFTTQDSLAKSYKDLYDFINNYFNNLDVQDEINNKLNTMAADGSLLTLFTKFYPIVTPEMYGCKGDGVTNDTENFMKAINAVKGKNIVLMLVGTYKTDDIIISDKINICGNGAKIVANKVEIYKNIIDNSHTIIDNVVFESTNGVSINGGKNIIFSNNTIINDNIALELSRTKFATYECIVSNCCIYAKTKGSTGILVNTSDCTIENINMRDFSTALKVNWQVTVNNLHSWISQNNYIDGSIFCDIAGGAPNYGELEILNSCIDTYQTAFKMTKNPNVMISNCRSTFNTSIYGNNNPPTIFNIDYAYPIEYLKLRAVSNNFEGNYSNIGTFSNIYLKPLMSENYINGWSDFTAYTSTFFKKDITHTPADFEVIGSELWNGNIIEFSFSCTATFEKKETQLFYSNTPPNNKSHGYYAICIESDIEGNTSTGVIFVNDTGIYYKPSKAGKLTISCTVSKYAPCLHTD